MKDALEKLLSSIGKSADGVKIWMSDGCCKVKTAFFNIPNKRASRCGPVAVETLKILDLLNQKVSGTRLRYLSTPAIRSPFTTRALDQIRLFFGTGNQPQLEATYPEGQKLLLYFNQSLYNASSRGRRVEEYSQLVEENIRIEKSDQNLGRKAICVPLWESIERSRFSIPNRHRGHSFRTR